MGQLVTSVFSCRSVGDTTAEIKNTIIMNPLVVISALFASAIAAPTATVLPAGTVALPHAAHLGYAHAVAPATTAVSGGLAPAGTAHGGQSVVPIAPVVRTEVGPAVPQPAPYVGHKPAVISLPAPHVTVQKNSDVTTLHKPAPIITKQVHLGQTQYISGYNTQILKPAIPDFKIAVPTALKGTQTVSAPIVTVQKEVHTVNEAVPVEKPYNVPYDVPVTVEKIVEVPTPYHVAKPVPVPHPVPVAGEPIIQRVQGAPIVRNHHHVAHAAPVVAQPALGYAHAGYAHGLAGVAGYPLAHAIAAPAAVQA